MLAKKAQLLNSKDIRTPLQKKGKVSLDSLSLLSQRGHSKKKIEGKGREGESEFSSLLLKKRELLQKNENAHKERGKTVEEKGIGRELKKVPAKDGESKILADLFNQGKEIKRDPFAKEKKGESKKENEKIPDRLKKKLDDTFFKGEKFPFKKKEREISSQKRKEDFSQLRKKESHLLDDSLEKLLLEGDKKPLLKEKGKGETLGHRILKGISFSEDFLENKKTVQDRGEKKSLTLPLLGESKKRREEVLEKKGHEKFVLKTMGEKAEGESSPLDLLNSRDRQIAQGDGEVFHSNYLPKELLRGDGDLNHLNPREVQVIDLSSIKAESKVELLQKISHYVENSYVASQESVDLIIQHQELGAFRVHVQKMGPLDQVNLEINTLTEKGHDFFARNEVELLKNLQHSGVRLNHFKIAHQADFFAGREGGFAQGSSGQGFGQDQAHGNSQGGGEASLFTGMGSQGDNRGQQRRRDLWQEAKRLSEELYT